MSATTATYTLPMPISVNAIYRNTSAKEREMYRRAGKKAKFRVKSNAYEQWQYKANQMLHGQSLKKVSGPVRVEIKLPSKKRRGDCDNRAKSVLDYLVNRQLMDDDRHVQSMWIGWCDVDDCEVTISQVTL